MTGVLLDTNKHARFQFGEYILAHSDLTNNTMDKRATDAIYLRPSGNKQGGFFAFDIRTGERIHRMYATSVPTTNTVIERVHEIAKQQGVFAD